MMAELQTQLFDKLLPSPLVLASGPRSYGAEGIWAAFEAGAGGVVTKTIRLKAAVNPTPHIATTHNTNLRNTLYNSEQWSDLTWRQWVEAELPALAGHPGVLIASLGHTAQEVNEMVEFIVATGVVDIIECVAYSSDDLANMIRAVRHKTDLPVLAKLTFNWGERLMSIAEEALSAGASGFTAIDSLGPTLHIDIETGRSLHAGKQGKAWMSGAAIKPVSLAIVAELATHFGQPVIGTGGIVTAEDVIEMALVGANAVGACTAPLLYGLEWFGKTATKVSEWLECHGHSSLVEIHGAALPLLQADDDTGGISFQFNPIHCTLCGRCVVACAYGARELIGEEARSPDLVMRLDEVRCRKCGLCVEVCKPGALTYSDWPRQP
jgi:dihydroorotate dehydrogenase/NAD-dependent dihydropyrimidine dehydrogenase PreA subunit